MCGEYFCRGWDCLILDDLQCYVRSSLLSESHSKFIYFDFECMQDEIIQCKDGHQFDGHSNSKCIHYNDSTCGCPQHMPNFVVAHSTCNDRFQQEVNSLSMCITCGSRCNKGSPCPQTCSYREKIFKGNNLAHDFGK